MITRKRNGLVLVLVLALIAILALSTLGIADRMISERRSVQHLGQQAQARALADSGVEMTRLFLERSLADQNLDGGWYDNPDQFRDVVVVDDTAARDRGRFSIVAPLIKDHAPADIRFGLEDESSRINLRTILKADQSGEINAKKMLMALPAMTDDIAAAMLDWIDEDSTPRQQGAEAEAYTALSPGYTPRNGAPATIEELLLVRGVTPQLLFGLDAALMAGNSSVAGYTGLEGFDNSDGSMDHGWAAYLTLYSLESNLREDGTAKINLNDSDLKKLYDDLNKAFGDQWATFIVAYRQSGSQGTTQSASSGRGDTGSNRPQRGRGAPIKEITAVQGITPGGGGGSGARGGKSGSRDITSSSGKLDFTKKASTNINSVLDLVGVSTTATYEGGTRSSTLTSPFTADNSAMSSYLPKLLDNTTTAAGDTIPGRINVNQAPRCVLAGIPGMTPDVVDQIMAKRTPDAATNPNHRYVTWILTEGLVKLDTMKSLLPYITAGGCVYRVNVVGHFDDRGPVAHLEVLLNAGKKPTSVLFWKDVSHLAIGYTPDSETPMAVPTSDATTQSSEGVVSP